MGSAHRRYGRRVKKVGSKRGSRGGHGSFGTRMRKNDGDAKMADYHLAQVNIARALYPLDDPRIAEFMENLARINALAEQSAGFVWRLQDEAGNATSIQAFE